MALGKENCVGLGHLVGGVILPWGKPEFCGCQEDGDSVEEGPGRPGLRRAVTETLPRRLHAPNS